MDANAERWINRMIMRLMFEGALRSRRFCFLPLASLASPREFFAGGDAGGRVIRDLTMSLLYFHSCSFVVG
jgi:hypothetical protein